MLMMNSNSGSKKKRGGTDNLSVLQAGKMRRLSHVVGLPGSGGNKLETHLRPHAS